MLRELTLEDAPFVLELLNTPKFIKYIADRGVRTLEDARRYTDERFLASYAANGFGLYLVQLKIGADPRSKTQKIKSIGVCGFVRRDTLPGPDIGFAFLPEYEGKGYGFEAASAVIDYGRTTLGLGRVLAITSLGNDASGRLLIKLGFSLDGVQEINGESLKVYSSG